MKRTKYQIISIALIVLFNSCTAYHPQLVHIPLIRERGDLKIDCGFYIATSGMNEDGYLEGLPGVNFAISYGITDMLAAQIYMSFVPTPVASWMHLHGALGIFRPVGDRTVMELYGGYGFGGSFLDGFYQLAFTQFNLGQTGISRLNLDYGFGFRVGHIFGTEHLSEQNNGMIIEPSVFLRFGLERIRFSLQFNYLWTRTVVENLYHPFGIGVGMHVSLNTRRW